jgi:GrpB-like predicted nucleotidyltransferase (UPF0157 family)
VTVFASWSTPGFRDWQPSRATHVVAVEHIGSTFISGMPSKPIIDILAGVTIYDEFDLVVQRLAAIGHLHTPESEADNPARRFVRKGPIVTGSG